jgi:hypothetical protein
VAKFAPVDRQKGQVGRTSTALGEQCLRRD